MLSRRMFLASGVSFLIEPLFAVAQPAGRMYRIGFLHFGSGGPRVTLREALVELGYIEGKRIAFVIRAADGVTQRLPGLAAELVALKVDLIVAVAPAAIRAAKAATATIPIVMAYWGGPDLVESGIVASLARPGGNVTGVHMLATALDGKRLELLLDVVPKAKTVAVAIHGGMPAWVNQLKPVQTVADRMGVRLHVADVDTENAGYQRAFDSIRRAGVDALLVPSSPLFFRDRRIIIDLVAEQRLPAIYEWPLMAQDGGLMAYAASMSEMDRQVAVQMDKILRGARPSDLPIEQPTKFDLVINLKTAKALGLTIPPSLLARADQVIE